jgi:hypothetical protein
MLFLVNDSFTYAGAAGEEPDHAAPVTSMTALTVGHQVRIDGDRVARMPEEHPGRSTDRPRPRQGGGKGAAALHDFGLLRSRRPLETIFFEAAGDRGS